MTERLVWLRMLLVVGFTVLSVRLLHLQLVRGAHYRRLADENRLRLVYEPAPRGLMFDRHGRVLATNHTVFRVAVVPQELEDFNPVASHVAAVLHRPAEALQREYAKERTLSFIPAVIASGIPKESAIRLEEDRWQFPGLLVKPETARHYPLGRSASHVLGYLSQPTAEQYPLLKPYGVRPKQLVGRDGLEGLLEHALRGQSGGLMVEVDHRARQVRVIGRKPPVAGADVQLTIDVNLQALIEQMLDGQAGAAVVLEPHTGELLAMVSAPAFFPEAFVIPDQAAVRGYLQDELTKPLLNRSARAFTPGSIMKLVTAAAGLEHHVITPSTTITCPGSITIGDRTFHCWNRDGHGPMTLTDAIMQSCNVYFITVARRLGLERLRAAQEQMGFGRRTGWPFDEQAGTLPRRRLTEGEVGLLGIGQGEILVTPLQAAAMAGAFANGGWLIEPSIVKTVDGRPLSHRPSRRRVPWSASTMDAVRAGMQAVISHPGGTGHRAWNEAISIAGKTGTAQTHVPGRTHAWFVGYCPVDEPRAAMAILAEFGGSGGDLPAAIARIVCEYLAVPQAPDTVQTAEGIP